MHLRDPLTRIITLRAAATGRWAAWIVVACGCCVSLLHAEPVNLTAGAQPDAAAPATVPTPPLGEPAIDAWETLETRTVEVRELTDRTQTDLLRQPYHSRAPSWIQSATDLQTATTERLNADAERAAQERRTIEWLLEDDARRQAQGAAASAPVAKLAQRMDALVPLPTNEPSGLGWLAQGWIRTTAIVVAFGLAVSLGLLLLKRRPLRRRRRHARSGSNSLDLTRRRRHRRRTGSAGTEAPMAEVPPPNKRLRRRTSRHRRAGHAGSPSPGNGNAH